MEWQIFPLLTDITLYVINNKNIISKKYHEKTFTLIYPYWSGRLVFMHNKPNMYFYFIGDGMGINQVQGTEIYRAELKEKKTGNLPLLFTQFPYSTIATTYSASNRVTDSQLPVPH